MSQTIPASQRLEQWERKYDPKRIEEITTAGKPSYKARAGVVFEDQYAMELAVKQVLNGIGVPVSDVGLYLAFARQLWAAKNKHHGETLSLEGQVIIDKWVARRLAKSTLEAIAVDVFDIHPPVAP